MNNPIVSLCIPTNGVIEWVFPVLDSIYSQDCDYNDFEVILTDNGNNKEFKEKINRYRKQYSNLYYFETKALGFLNEIESYKFLLIYQKKMLMKNQFYTLQMVF